mmetsp:Transcript_33381/g.54130  ORF Transcript_33381/g.54130 Transcript_33381/m.54130 type:complete len:110 (-) Transcript_33381:13-342(-)
MDAVLLLPMPEDVAEESDAFFFVLWLALLFMHVQEHFASYIQWGACTIKMMVWFILSLIAEAKVVLDIFCTRPQWPVNTARRVRHMDGKRSLFSAENITIEGMMWNWAD